MLCKKSMKWGYFMNGQIIFATIENLITVVNKADNDELDCILKTIRILLGKLNISKWALDNGYKFAFWYNFEDEEFEFYEINDKF